MMKLSEVADFLSSRDDFFILTHQFPDGDTLGSACALCLALHKLGKSAKILCSDPIPRKYQFMFDNISSQEFEPQTIVSVDIADVKLLGDKLSCYKDKIDLCIDHHASNRFYSDNFYIDSDASATAEIIYELLLPMNVDIGVDIAQCLYTGIATDTGCFKYTNTTSKTHAITAELLKRKIDAGKINHCMFDVKSREKMMLEKSVLETLEFSDNGSCALIYITREMLENSGVTDDELEGFASMPRKIEGVLVGVTMREKEDSTFKISVRCDDKVNASNICAKFDGGGHRCAAGCTIEGDLVSVKNKILQAVKAEMKVSI